MKKCIIDGELQRDLPTGALLTIEALLDALSDAQIPSPPQLLSFEVVEEDEEGRWSYDMDLEVAHGVVLRAEGEYQDGDHGPATRASVVADAMEGLEVVRRDLERYAQILHEARLAARKVLARWHDAGTPTRLIDVRLDTYDRWRGSIIPHLQVIIEALDERLRPAIEKVNILHPSMLVPILDVEQEAVRNGLRKRRSMMAEGADGMVDQLVINAMAHHGDVAAHLRLLGKHAIYWLADATCIAARNGHVTAGTGDPNADVQWMENGVSVRRTSIPETQLMAAVGRPVQTLMEHPFLSPDMIIEHASCEDDDEGESMLSITFSQRTHWFCMSSGRFWDGDERRSGIGAPFDAAGLVERAVGSMR